LPNSNVSAIFQLSFTRYHNANGARFIYLENQPILVSEGEVQAVFADRGGDVSPLIDIY